MILGLIVLAIGVAVVGLAVLGVDSERDLRSQISEAKSWLQAIQNRLTDGEFEQRLASNNAKINEAENKIAVAYETVDGIREYVSDLASLVESNDDKLRDLRKELSDLESAISSLHKPTKSRGARNANSKKRNARR